MKFLKILLKSFIFLLCNQTFLAADEINNQLDLSFEKVSIEDVNSTLSIKSPEIKDIIVE
jgi:hypothetical protein